MEAETDSPEDASPVCVPLVKSFKNIGSEEITFPQKHGNDVNSKYPLVEEKGNADSSKTDEVSEIRPQEIHQESCKVFVGSEKQTEVPAGWSKQRDSEGMVMTESIPKSSIEEQGKVPGEHEHEHMSTIPELAINPTEVAVKICEEETYKEEEGLTATDNDQSCRPENELDETSKALEAIDQTQFTGKDTAEYEHADHQSEAPSTENVIAKHSNSEQLPTKSSIKSNCDEEPLEKTLELYSVDNSEIKKDGKVMSEKAIGVPADGTLKTLSTTACVGAAELENKDEGKFTLEKEKEMEAATDMQLLKSATDSPPDNKDLPAVSTSEFVKGHTDEIPQQQTHKNDETSVTDTGKSSAESDDDEKLDKEEKAIEEAIKTQLVNTETESLPEEEVQLRLPTPDIVQQNTDQIIKEQPLNQDQPDMIDNAQSCIAEKEPDRVIEEPVEIETKHNIRILKEQEDQQSEEKSMQNVTANSIIEGHVTPKSSTKVADDVHKSDSIKNLEKKDANEIREVEATDVKQSTNVEKQKAEAKGMSEDKGLQTLPSAELVGNKAIEESCKGHIKPEAGLAVTYANEEQALQHEFDKKEEILEEEACQLTAESEAKPEPQIVAQNNETTCIKHPYLDREASEMNPIVDTIEHEISMPHAKFNQEEEKGTEKETKMQLEDTTESVPKEETIQPIAIAELVRIKAHDESSPEANVTVKSNKEVQTSNVIENEEIWDTGKCNQVEEEQTTEEPTKSQLQEEQVQTRSPTPASVHGDPNQIWQQETLYINESEINDNDKQGSIPKIAQDPKLTIAQETDKPETEDNVGIVTEKLENKHASEIRSKEGTDAKQLTDVEIPKSEIEGVSIDEAQQPIANTVFVGTEVVDEGSGEEIESEADAKLLSNNEEQRPEYVTEGTVGINDTNYTYEKEGVPTSPVSVKEGIENDRKFSKEEESKRVEEKTKMQLQEEQVQTRSPTPISVQGDSNQIHQQETLCIDESEVFDNAKQWCIAAIELEKDTTVVQETRNSETNDKIITVAENLHHKDETEIKEEEGTYAQKSTEVEMLQSEREGMPVDEAQQTMANAVSVRSEALDESSQEEILPEAYVTEKSNKEVKTPESVTNEVVETNTTNYTEKQEVPKGYVRERGRIGDKFNQEKEVEGIEATNTQLLEEEVQIRSSTYVSVQSDINQIPQQQTVNVNESEVIEIAIVVQESEVSEAKDNASRVIENLDKDESEIRAEDGTDAKELTDLDMSKSETEEKIQDDGKFNQREKEKRIDEVTEILTPEEEVHTTSPTPAFVKSHTDITEQQIAFHLNESNVIATAKQSCIPEFEHDRNPTVVQEIEVFETKHNIDRVMENSDKEKTKIRENEKTDATQLNEESGQQDKQLEADITDKSNKKVKTPEYVTEENLETNITDYAEEKNKSPTDHAKEKEGIEAIFNQEEKEKLIEETTKTHSEEEEVQTHAPAFVLGDTNQIPHQETMHANESKVMDNAKQSYIPEIELDEKAIVLQETEVSESLYKKDPTEIRVKKEIDAKKLTDSEMPKPETEEDEEALQPIADVVLVRTEVVEESGKQETQPKEDVTDKSNREVLIKKFVTEEGAEINTNNCTKEHDTVQASPANELEGTDDVKLHEEEADEIEEKTKTQIPEEEFQTSSPTPAFVQDDSGQTLQQETVNIDESEVLDNDKHSCIPEIELDGKSTVVEETNNPAIEDNISTGAKDLDNKDAIEVRAEEGTYVKQLTNVEIPNSEIKEQETEKPETKDNVGIITENKGTNNARNIRAEEATDSKKLADFKMHNPEIEETDMSDNEVPQPVAITATTKTKTVDDSNYGQIQLEDLIEKESNKEEQTLQYVAEDTVKINTNNYTNEHDKVQDEEAKDIEETTKMQLDEQKVQKTSPTPTFVQGDTDQISQQELLHIVESEVHYDKHSSIPEIEPDRKSTIVQETEKTETISKETENLGTNDASEISAKEETDVKILADLKMPKSEIQEDEVPQPTTIAVVDITKTVDGIKQEQRKLEEDIANKKSKEEQTPLYVAEDIAEINTNSYTEEHDKVQTSATKVKEWIEDDKSFGQQEEVKAIAETNKIQLPREDVQRRSHTLDFVQRDTDHISHQELPHVEDSEVIDYVKHSCIQEIELDRKSTIAQETEEPKHKDNISTVTENLSTNDGSEVKGQEQTGVKTLADIKMPKSKIEEEVHQPIAIAEVVITETVDDITVKKSNEEEKVQTLAPTPAFVHSDMEQISQEELLHVDESKVIEYVKQSCIRETELQRKSTIPQETEKPETKDNISKVTENLGTNDAREIKEEEETNSKKMADFKMQDSEIEVVPGGEVRQSIATAVAVITQTVDDSKLEQIQLDKDITEKKSNKEEQTPQFVAEDTAEINTTNYNDENQKVQTSNVEVKEEIEEDENFGQQQEVKAIGDNKMQLPKENVQTISPTPAYVQCNTDQILNKELLHVDESEIIDYVKQSRIPEIELDTTIAQETEKPETKDNISNVTENLGTDHGSEIRAEEDTYVKNLADLKIPESEIKETEVPEDEVPQPIAVAVEVETERVADINQKEIQPKEDITEKKSNKDEQSSHYVAKDTTELKANSYTDEHDKVQTSHAEVNQGTEGDEKCSQEENAKGIEEMNKMQLHEEEVQIRSSTPPFVQDDTDQISQQELLLVDESKVIDYVEQSCKPEIELDRKSTIVQQEIEKPETKDNVSILTENLGTNDASEIKAKEEIDAEKLADVNMIQSEIEGVPKDETPKPIANAVLLRTEAVEKSSQQDKQLVAEVADKSIKEVQNQEFIIEGNVEININSEAEEKDKNSTFNAEKKEGTSHANGKEGIEDIFNQKEKEKEIEEATKTHSVEEEEIQRRSPPPAFVQGDTDQIQHQETLHINESEVIDNAKLSHIPEIELHEKAIVVQKSEKLETKDNFDRVRENLNKAESENRAEEGIDVKQLTDLEMPKSETEAGVPEDESLQQMSDTVSVEKEAVSVSQEKRQPQEEFIKKVDEEVETPQYFIEDREKLETANDTEEQEEVPTSQPKEKSGNKDDNKFEEEQEEKGIEESTKTQLQDEDIRTTLPIQTSVQGDFDQILQKQTVHDNESKGIGNAERSCTQEIELNGKSTIVEEPETKDNVNIVKQEHADNQSEKSSIQGVTTTYNITEEGLVKSESNREISEVHIDEQDAVKSCSRENLHNKNACEIRVEKASEAKQSTYVEIQESETQDEPEDKALKRKLNSSSNGNEALDESSLEEFTENFNNDAQTPQRNTKVNAETNITTYPDKQQEFPACHANEKQGIQDKGKFEEEEAEEIEESIEKQLPEEEIQHTLPTPTSVQDNIDQMSQLQTLHDDEIEVIDNAKSCMPEIELDRKSIVVKESKQQETKANVDLVKEEQADNQSEESSVQSFITNYIIVERHTTSESNKELSDDVNPDGQKKVESHLVEFLEIKDASEIRAKGIHSKQLTDVEIQKSETEGMAEDRGMQTMSSTTSVKNDAFNECCQEEIQPREEYAETHIKEVNMPHYEFYMQKHIPEAYGVQEDTCQIRVENEQKFKSQLASLIKETTFIDNLYSDGEIEKTNPSNDVEKDVNPQSHNKEKLEIHDDSKFNEEEANGIEEMTKIKLLNSATDSPPEEVQPKLPDPATVQGDTGQILQQQTLAADASDTIDNNMRKIPENELDRMSTSVEEPETKANINIEEEEEEEQSDKQSHEPSMQSLITDYITVEGHLASENSSNMNEQKTVNLQLVENLGIKYASKPTTEEVTDAKQPTGVEVEKTKNEEMIENETLDESNQEEMQAEEDFSGTHTKGKQTPQSSMENVNSEGMEITESSTKSSYAEEEQEQVINPYTIENSEIKDGTKIKLEEASDIKEATDEPVTKAISVLSTIPSVRIWIVDESIQEKIQKDVQTSVINTKEEQRPENDFVRNMEVQEACDLKKGPGNTSVENDEKVEVQSEANNQKTIKKNPNLEELETAEISPSSDTKELGKEHEVAKLGGVSESVSIDITKQIDTGKLETQEAETGLSDNTKEDKAGEEFEKISPSSSVGVISKDSQDTSTKVLHKKSHGILSGVGSKVKHSISKVKKVITGKSSRPKTPPS
ncbi:titin isoform X22 [Vigna unguiculata]|uniref:titin isoform X22 n=1 Tax=Vigna unguiculata TaxID=3917 RepID=UPI0010167F0D|nr:titin isoform X22 [Vigna unguiculata]